MRAIPLGDRYIVKPLPVEEVTKGGIIIAETAKDKPLTGEVVAIGSKAIHDEIKIGSHIFYHKYAGSDFKEDLEDYLILDSGDILAVIK